LGLNVGMAVRMSSGVEVKSSRGLTLVCVCGWNLRWFIEREFKKVARDSA